MKKLLFSILGFVLAFTLQANDNNTNAIYPGHKLAGEIAKEQDPYVAGKVGFAYFASYRVREFDGVLDRFGSGPELSYAITRNLTVAIEGISENPQHALFDEAGINAKWYVPISDSGFSFYALLGYTRRFEDLPGAGAGTRGVSLRSDKGGKDDGGGSVQRLSGLSNEDGRNRMNAGLGIELRGKNNGFLNVATVAAFADGRWTHDFETIGHALFRLGARFDFGH